MTNHNFSEPATIASAVLGTIGGAMMLLPALSLATIPELTDKGRARLVDCLAIGLCVAASSGAVLATDRLLDA